MPIITGILSVLGIGVEGYGTYLNYDLAEQQRAADKREATMRVLLVGGAILAAGYMIAKAK